MPSDALYLEILKREYTSRLSKNKKYSKNAFARDIQLSPSRMSQILSGKLGISSNSAIKIAQRLALQPRDQELFCSSVNSIFSRKAMSRNQAHKKLSKNKLDSKFKTLKLDQFKVISDWQHYALLELLEIKSIRSDYSNLSELETFCKLSLSEMTDSLNRLDRLGLIRREEEFLKASTMFTSTPTDISSDVIKKNHTQILSKAATAIYNSAINDRDMSSIIFAVDKSKLEMAKKQIKKFRRKLVKDLTSGQNKDSVYCLAIQLFDIF